MTAEERSEETLWQCSVCGKWSHALKRPRSHQRAVFEQPPADAVVLSHEEPYYSELDESESREVWWIKCGPFDEWVAQRRPLVAAGRSDIPEKFRYTEQDMDEVRDEVYAYRHELADARTEIDRLRAVIAPATGGGS